MRSFISVVVITVAATAALIGCGGSGADTSNAKLVGNWVAETMTANGQTVPCPNEITSGSVSHECTRVEVTFASDGKVSVFTPGEGTENGTYRVEDDRVFVTLPSESMQFTYATHHGTHVNLTYNDEGHPVTLSFRKFELPGSAVVGNWLLNEMTVDGETVTCPGSVFVGDAEYDCERSTMHLRASGTVVASDPADETPMVGSYTYDGTNLSVHIGEIHSTVAVTVAPTTLALSSDEDEITVVRSFIRTLGAAL
jgi:hypothetical protein